MGAGVEVAGRSKKVVMMIEAAGTGSRQWRSVEATKVVTVVLVAGRWLGWRKLAAAS